MYRGPLEWYERGSRCAVDRRFCYKDYLMICGRLWDDVDATVACRELGYVSGTAYIHRGTPDLDHGLNYMIDFNCTGEEKFLKDCPHGFVSDSYALAKFCRVNTAAVDCKPYGRLIVNI